MSRNGQTKFKQNLCANCLYFSGLPSLEPFHPFTTSTALSWGREGSLQFWSTPSWHARTHTDSLSLSPPPLGASSGVKPRCFGGRPRSTGPHTHGLYWACSEPPPPTSPDFLAEDFRLDPGLLGNKVLLRRAWFDKELRSHCNFQKIHTLSKGK